MSEVIAINQADQFPSGKSQYMCGFYAVAMVASQAPYGATPTKSSSAISDLALAYYASYNGSNAAWNSDGMSLEQEYSMLRSLGLHYNAISPDDGSIAASLRSGRAVVATIAEYSVTDTALGRNPYPWNPAGNHVVVITGIASDNTFFVRDSANCTDLYDPGSLRPGPRTYDRSRLVYGAATSIVSPSQPGAQIMSQVPAGWSDNGSVLTAPNKVAVVSGFREYVLSHSWNPENYPDTLEHYKAQLEYADPNLGGGTAQIFRWIVLEYPDKSKKVIEMWVGQELAATQSLLLAAQAEVAKLQVELAKAGAPDMSAVKAFIETEVTHLQQFMNTL